MTCLTDYDRLIYLTNDNRLTGLAYNGWLTSLLRDNFALRSHYGCSRGEIILILLKLDYSGLLGK